MLNSKTTGRILRAALAAALMSAGGAAVGGDLKSLTVTGQLKVGGNPDGMAWAARP